MGCVAGRPKVISGFGFGIRACRAQVTVDSWTLELRVCPGLFLAGELLDVDGPCGGYNLQWAWASGAVAGSNAAAD